MLFINNNNKINFFSIQKIFLNYLKCNLYFLISKLRIKYLDLEVQVSSWNIYPVIAFLKKNNQTQFQMLVDITVYDILSQYERFIIVYSLLSPSFNRRIYIITKTNEITPLISINSIFYVAGWIEREIWDFFGILFFLHKDLRRILTDYGFDHYPLRKDFPLTGLFETMYDDNQKRIVNKRLLSLNQEYRVFNLDFN